MVKLLRRWRRPRPRARLAWLGLWALLLQQLALVAYACPLESVEAGQATLMVGCEEMPAPDPDAPALCDQHCLRLRRGDGDKRVEIHDPSVVDIRHGQRRRLERRC